MPGSSRIVNSLTPSKRDEAGGTALRNPPVDASKITRVEVIDETGRAYVKWNCKVEESIQDQGRTLKLFVSEEDEINKES